MAQHFEAAEERSLGLLTYVNDLQAEVEALEDHVAGLQRELVRLQRPVGGGQDALTEVTLGGMSGFQGVDFVICVK